MRTGRQSGRVYGGCCCMMVSPPLPSLTEALTKRRQREEGGEDLGGNVCLSVKELCLARMINGTVNLFLMKSLMKSDQTNLTRSVKKHDRVMM